MTKILEANQSHACCLRRQENASFSLVKLTTTVQQLNNHPETVVEEFLSIIRVFSCNNQILE